MKILDRLQLDRRNAVSFRHRALSILGLLTSALCLICCLMSCAGPGVYPCRIAYGELYLENLDSLGVDAYRALPPADREHRQRLAEQWRQRARTENSTDMRLQALRNMVGLVPDQSERWLELANLTWTLGDYQGTRDYCYLAMQTLPYARASERNGLHLRINLLNTWLYYDAGEWRQGLLWAERAAEVEAADRRVLLLRGLCEAGAERSLDATFTANEIERIDVFRSDWRWIRGMTEFYQMRPKTGTHYFFGARPDELYRSKFWNDMGLVFESLGDWREARDMYKRAFKSLPLPDKSCLSVHEWQAPQADQKAAAMPVWLAFDRFFVAGSVSGFISLASERFQTTTEPAERQYWGEAAIRAASICLRKHHNEAWARAARGKIYAFSGLEELARNDLQRAIEAFTGSGWVDAEALFWTGHLLLRDEQYHAARPPLEQAVAADSTLARAWCDLGLALVMTDEEAGAKTALDRALALDPTLAVAWYNRGLMHYHAK
ncbi:MAG: hypothetical protein ABIF77_04685, partial [bacterium]